MVIVHKEYNEFMKSQLRNIIKFFWDYDIINDMRIYQLRNTPIKIKTSLCKNVQKKYGSLPVNPNKIVFNNYMGKGYGDNCKYVTEELLRTNQNMEIVWVVDGIEQYRSGFPSSIRLVEYKSEDAMYEYCTAGIWVSNYHLIEYFNRGLIKKEKQTYIQLWHGSLGIKKIEKDCASLTESKSWTYLAQKNSELTDYWISNSTFESEVYKSAFWSVKNILELGHPRNDILFLDNHDTIEEKVKKYLNVNKEDKLVLYAPTFREGNDGAIPVLKIEELRDALRESFGGEWKVIIRTHPRANEQLELLCNERSEHIRVANDYPDIQELMICADVAITDYSSWIFDYMLTKKPGFILAPDMSEYNSQRGFYYRIETTPFPIALSHQQLIENIHHMDVESYKRNVDEFLLDKGCIEDGQASESMVKFIRDIRMKGNKEWN